MEHFEPFELEQKHLDEFSYLPDRGFTVGFLMTPNTVGVNPKEKCQVAHAGQCGVCNNDGTFTPCA